MRKVLSVFAVSALIATPAFAQTAPVRADQAPAVKTVKKLVCKRIETDQVSGSRLSATTKVCREVEVRVKEEASKGGSSSDSMNAS